MQPFKRIFGNPVAIFNILDRMPVMELSIVLLHTNGAKDAQKCLQSLQSTWLPSDYEIIVISNGDYKANPQIDPNAYTGLNVQFYDLIKDGYIRGNNYGYSIAKGEYILTINPDILVQEDTIKLLLEHCKAHPECGIVAPRLIFPDGIEQDSARPFPKIQEIISRRMFKASKTSIEPQWSEEYRKFDWVTGAMFIMTRECYEKTGGHDKRYYLFMSDISICWNAWQAELEVHQLRDAKATHNENRLSGSKPIHMITKYTGRAHMRDACKYFVLYGFKRPPALSPSGKVNGKS